MIKSRILPLLLVILLVPIHILTFSVVSNKRKQLQQGQDVAYVLPGPLLKVTTLEFDGLASDFLFLKALVYYGGTVNRKERPRVKDWEFRWLYSTLQASTDLDPYFYDPYYFANSILTWDGNMVRETNSLLAKGSRYRDWDYMLPLFMGFNSFFFLHDSGQASEYLIEGAKRPGGEVLSRLAVRWAVKGKRTENAILFLRQMLKTTKNVATRKEYETRLQALEAILLLERAVDAYKTNFSKQPFALTDLLRTGIISGIPKDPYGGKFYLDQDATVETTSNLFEARRK